MNNTNDIRIDKVLKSPNYPVQNIINYVTPNEMKLIIKKLPNKKSPGHDIIINLRFKKLPSKVIVLITTLFNAILRLVIFYRTGKNNHNINKKNSVKTKTLRQL